MISHWSLGPAVSTQSNSIAAENYIWHPKKSLSCVPVKLLKQAFCTKELGFPFAARLEVCACRPVALIYLACKITLEQSGSEGDRYSALLSECVLPMYMLLQYQYPLDMQNSQKTAWSRHAFTWAPVEITQEPTVPEI